MIELIHLPYSKSIHMTYDTIDEAETVLDILAQNGISGKANPYTG